MKNWHRYWNIKEGFRKGGGGGVGRLPFFLGGGGANYIHFLYISVREEQMTAIRAFL